MFDLRSIGHAATAPHNHSDHPLADHPLADHPLADHPLAIILIGQILVLAATLTSLIITFEPL
jgi:hypothetical protein